MAESSFNIEGATNGLVLALFLASTLFLGVMLYYVLRDIDERQSPSDSDSAQAPSVVVPHVGWPGGLPASTTSTSIAVAPRSSSSGDFIVYSQ